MGRASKQKGAQFERDICRALSIWVSHGTHKDLFWRSAMSGGRATLGRRKGEPIRQAGDITCVTPEGHSLTDRFYIECKFYKELRLTYFLVDGAGPLAMFWKETCLNAVEQGRFPLLIAKQNGIDTLLLTLANGDLPIREAPLNYRLIAVDDIACAVFRFDEIMRLPYDDAGHGKNLFTKRRRETPIARLPSSQIRR